MSTDDIIPTIHAKLGKDVKIVTGKQLLDMGVETRNRFSSARLARQGITKVNTKAVRGITLYAMPGVDADALLPDRGAVLDFARNLGVGK